MSVRVPSLARIGISSALLAATLGAAHELQASAERPAAALEARPAGLPLPELPGIDRPEVPVAPTSRRLDRDQALSDRFTAQDQGVEYPFEARAGELSLFELYAAGYARGWMATAGMRVLDSKGTVLAERIEEGGVVLRPFVAFVAPAGGEYRLELRADKQFFRYALVRHSSYAARAAGELRVPAERERVHGWLSDGADRMSFAVALRAGEELALSVEGTREEARAERRSMLAGGDAAMAGGMRRSMERMDGRTAPGGRGGDVPRQFPELRLQIDRQGEVVDRSATFVRLAPERDGEVRVSVTGLPGERGGLFDLVVRRAFAKQRVHGVVVDAADELRAGVEVAFLLEPDLEPWGRAKSDERGAYELDLPAGDYRVVLRPPGDGAEVSLRAGVEGETELNLILPGT